MANLAANQGQSVTVVEKGPLGGTCLNRGCIPSKMLLYHADVLETVERAGDFKIGAEVTDIDFGEIVQEVNEEVTDDADSIRRGLESSPQHTLFEGEAHFVDERTVEVIGGDDDSARLEAETVLVAASTRPSIPDIDGIEDVDYLTSTEAHQLEEVPDRLVIVSGGYIAAELGHFFETFGSDVSIVGRRPHLLPTTDEEVGEAFTERYAERFDVYTGYEAIAVRESGEEITVDASPYPPDSAAGAEGSSSDDAVTVTGDELLVATGRVPSTDTLNVDAAGIETDEQGFVETDEYLRTTADGVWALGDIVGEYLLKHNANHEAKAVVRNIFGDDLQAVDYSAIPYAVFASPEVAGVGAHEEKLRTAEEEFATNVYRYEETARGDAMQAEGFVKVLIDLEGEILGCHIIGPDASSLIQEVVVAMQAGSGTVQDIRESVHIHPALPEVVDRAFAGQFSRGGSSHHDHSH